MVQREQLENLTTCFRVAKTVLGVDTRRMIPQDVNDGDEVPPPRNPHPASLLTWLWCVRQQGISCTLVARIALAACFDQQRWLSHELVPIAEVAHCHGVGVNSAL